MLQSLKSWFGRYSLLLLLLLALISTPSCTQNPLSLLTGGGPSVNANVLAGQEVTQQLVANQNRQDAGRDVVTNEIKKEVEADSVEEVEINNTNIPPWVILLLLLGWLLPTPQEMIRDIFNAILDLTRRRKKRK